MQTRKNILVFTSSFPVAGNSPVGGGHFVLQLSQQLAKYHKVFVLTPYISGAKTYDKWNGISIHRFRFIPFSNHKIVENGIFAILKKSIIYSPVFLCYIVAATYQLIKLVRKNRIGLIHCHWVVPQGAIVWLIKKLLPEVKIIVTAHGSDINKFTGKTFKKLKKGIFKTADCVLPVSKEIQEKINKIHNLGEIPIIPMGIDTKIFFPRESIKPDNETWLMFVGRLSIEKGIEYLIEAFSMIHHKYPTLILKIVGNGELKNNLKLFVKQNGIENKVHFEGFVSQEQLPKYYSSANIIVMPSISEGSPVVLPEAMACKGIVIASDIAVYKDLIQQGINGYVSKKADSNNLALTIENVLNNTENHCKIRQNSQKFAVENFSWEIIGKKYLSVLKNL